MCRNDKCMIKNHPSFSFLVVIGLISIGALVITNGVCAQNDIVYPFIDVPNSNRTDSNEIAEMNENEMQRANAELMENRTQVINTTKNEISILSFSQPNLDQARPNEVLSPVIGAIQMSGPTYTCSNSKWCFWQRKGTGHEGKVGIGAADDTYAWDTNLNSPVPDTDKGQPVYAVAPGTVCQTYGSRSNADDPSATYGQVLLEHSYQGSKWWSGYLHLANIQVKRGQSITTGTVVGYISNKNVPDGNNHLHFVVYTGENSYGKLISFDASIKPRYEYYGIDFNGDGKADLIHITGNDYVNTLLSNGDGSYNTITFTPWAGYATGSGIWGFGDINRDGMTDLEHISGGDFINTWISKGDGTYSIKYFKPWSGYATGIGQWYASDANGDGRSDLVHISGGDFINTWISKGDGTYSIKYFKPWTGYATGEGYWIMGDANGDGMSDPLHICNGFINTWMSNGDGTYSIKYFMPWHGYNTGMGKWGIGDVNADGKTDLIHVSGDFANTWISQGDGTYIIKYFKPWSGYATNAGKWYSADVNGDGKTDAEHISGGDTINTWQSKGDGTYVVKSFKPWSGYATGVGSWGIGDANANGKTDLEHIIGSESINTWLSNGDGTFNVKFFKQSTSYYSPAGGNTEISHNNSSSHVPVNSGVNSTFIRGYGIESWTDFIDVGVNRTAIMNQSTAEDLKRCVPGSIR